MPSSLKSANLAIVLGFCEYLRLEDKIRKSLLFYVKISLNNSVWWLADDCLFWWFLKDSLATLRQFSDNFITTLSVRRSCSVLSRTSISETGQTFIHPLIHGLGTPNEAFFHWNSELLGLGRQIGQIDFGAFGVLSAKLSAPIWVQWVSCPYFPLFNHYFYKKLNLYIHIPNIYLGLGFEFEFGPQRTKDLAFVCP